MFLRAMRCVWQGVSVVSHKRLYKRIQKRIHNRIHKGMHNNGTTAGQRRDNPGTTRHPDGQTLRQSDPMEADGTSSGLCYNNDHTLNTPCSGGLLLAFFQGGVPGAGAGEDLALSGTGASQSASKDMSP